jgi:LDH2 family malate/lactate/ureidoglycolate dehydrogenase
MQYADSDTVIVRVPDLTTLVRQILVAAGMSEENARIVGSVVVAASATARAVMEFFAFPAWLRYCVRVGLTASLKRLL